MQRHINEPDIYDGAKYLLICTGAGTPGLYQMCCGGCPFCLCDDWSSAFTYLTAQPTKPHFSQYRCFLGELVGFLAGVAGKTFDDPAPDTCGWNQVVDDLITETANAKSIYMGRATQEDGKSSRVSGQLFITSAKASDFFTVAGGSESGGLDGPPTAPEEWGSSDGEISIVEVIIEQKD